MCRSDILLGRAVLVVSCQQGYQILSWFDVKFCCHHFSEENHYCPSRNATSVSDILRTAAVFSGKYGDFERSVQRRPYNGAAAKAHRFQRPRAVTYVLRKLYLRHHLKCLRDKMYDKWKWKTHYERRKADLSLQTVQQLNPSTQSTACFYATDLNSCVLCGGVQNLSSPL